MNKSQSKYFNTAAKMNLALISLLKNKPFEYITVSELCKTAGVNRSTFYLHYETIGDLLGETTRYLLDGFRTYFSDETVNISDCSLDELFFICERYLTPYLSYVKENKEIFSTVLSHMGVFEFEKVYNRLFENIFSPILERFDYLENDKRYVMAYYLNGITAIVNEWLKSGCDKPIDEVSDIIKICIYGKKESEIK